jgi:hypothetical protein
MPVRFSARLGEFQLPRLIEGRNEKGSPAGSLFLDGQLQLKRNCQLKTTGYPLMAVRYPLPATAGRMFGFRKRVAGYGSRSASSRSFSFVLPGRLQD